MNAIIFSLVILLMIVSYLFYIREKDYSILLKKHEQLEQGKFEMTALFKGASQTNKELREAIDSLKQDKFYLEKGNNALIKQLDEINNIPVVTPTEETFIPLEDTLLVKVQGMVHQLQDVDFFLQQYSTKRQLITAFRMQLERWLS